MLCPMLDRLLKLRKAAEKAVDAARTKPAETLKSVTEGMLRQATKSGVPPEAAATGSAAAARLWTRISPKDPLARTRLGEALVRDGRPVEAAEELEHAATTRTEVGLLAESWLARAEVLGQKLPEAIARIEKITHVLPQPGEYLSAQVRGVVALAALDTFRVDLAEKILATSEDEPVHLLARGRLAMLNGELEKSRELIGRAARSGLDEAFAWVGIAMAMDGDTKGAWTTLKELRLRGPEGPWILAAMGWLRFLDGQSDADDYLRRALDLMPNHAGAAFLRGLIAEGEENLEEAKEWYEKARESAREWAAPQLGIVRAAVAAGDWDEARQTARGKDMTKDGRFLSALTLGLSGHAKDSIPAWDELTRDRSDRDWLSKVSTQRAAVAWKLGTSDRPEAAVAVWKEVASHASQAGNARITLARWAVDASRRALEAAQPPYYAIEGSLGAASALRPSSEDLVVAHCAATFLARGPAASRTKLENAVARGSTDERITGMLALIDAISKGEPVSVTPLSKATAATDAAARARAGDAAGCLERLEALEAGDPPPAVQAVAGGARALSRLAQVPELLREGSIDEAIEVLSRSLEHIPAGVQRDRVIHDLAAVCTIAARREDEEARKNGEPPSSQSIIRWQEALGHWSDLASSPAYFADLAKRVLELDDPRLLPRDVDSLRASLHSVVAGLPAAYAADALERGHHRRARYFVSLIIGAPLSDLSRDEALVSALEPLTRDARRAADEAKETAKNRPPSELLTAYKEFGAAVMKLSEQMMEAAPEGTRPISDALDELALALVTFFENLYDRANLHGIALDALAQAVEIAASETLGAELKGKLERMEGRG